MLPGENSMAFARILFLSILGAFPLSQLMMAKTVQADPASIWQFSRHKHATSKIDTAQLVYGIPETDAVVAMASCSTDSAGKVDLNFSANVAGPDKAKVSAKIFGKSIDALAIIPESGEGLTGLGITIPLNDPLLASLATKPSLTYGLNGGADRTIPLSKGKASIKKFIQACKSFAALKHAAKTKQ